MLAVAAGVTGSAPMWGISAGIVPGVIDLVGLGLRMPLWARLNQRAAATSINLRFLSRLVVLAVYFYLLHRYTRVSLDWAVAGIFVPHAVYLLWAVRRHRARG